MGWGKMHTSPVPFPLIVRKQEPKEVITEEVSETVTLPNGATRTRKVTRTRRILK